jgi:hypothetical protein
VKEGKSLLSNHFFEFGNGLLLQVFGFQIFHSIIQPLLR